MLSIGSLSSASGAAGYLAKGGEGHAAGYYQDAQPHSKWGGGAKEALGLPDGPVEMKTLEGILDGRVSDTQTLGRMIDGVRRRDPGRDFTFSAPKSVSLAATGEMEKPIITGVLKAVDTALSYHEQHFAQARVWGQEKGKQVRTGGQKTVYASFLDYVSRANDPQIHVHNAVANIAIGEDGKIRSQDYALGYKHKILLGAIFRAELAKEMQNLGFQIRPAGKNGLWELAGSQDEILKTFSKRRSEMVRQAPHKVGDAKAMARMAITTRPAKVQDSKEGLLERWNNELTKLGTSTKSFVQSLHNAKSPDLSELTPKTALDFAVAYHSENERHFDRYSFLRTAMTRVYGHVDIGRMEAELDKRLSRDKLRESKDGRWLIPTQTLKTEQSILGKLEKGHLQGRVLNSSSFASVKGLSNLSPGQQKAAELLLTGNHRYIGIKGTAGTGKTYLLEKALPALKANGYEIIGIAPSHKALSGLKATQVFDKTFTVQSFEKAPYGHSKAVLVLDEASMVGNRAMQSILNFANTKNMPRVALIGDPNQLPSIEAGRPFADLLEHGLRAAHMDDIIRQKEARHRQGVRQLSRGDITQAFQTLDKEIREVSPKTLIQSALDIRKTMKDPAIVVTTNKEREQINQAIKASKDNFGPELKLKVWQPVHLKQAEKKLTQSYARATHIRFDRDVGRHFKRGEIYRISAVEPEKARLLLSQRGNTKAFYPARHGSGDSFTRMFNQSEITLHKGDRIKFRNTDKKLGISNNDFGKIESITNKDIQIRLDNQKTIRLGHKHRILRHLDYGWANTVHSFQGATVRDNIAIMRADHNPLNTLEALYVGASRHQEKLAIVTDNTDQLLRVISEKLEISKERIEFKEPRRMMVIDTQKILSTEAQKRPDRYQNTNRENTQEKPSVKKSFDIDRHRGDRSR